MRISPRAILTSVAACALAVGWISAPGAAAGPASDPAVARHIVVLHDDADSDAVARDHGRRHGAEVKGVYHHALKGYVATFKGSGAADVARDPRVAFVELDRPVSVHGETQSIAASGPWGLDRIDQPGRSLDGLFHYNATGTGVTAYIIDTGIRYSHSEVAGRAVKGFDAFGGTGDDCDGHGTHVAGTVGGSTYGVAKNVRLVSVRVLDCSGSGSYSGVIAGVDYVTAAHAAGTPAVANMSLGGPTSSALDAAINRSINDGVTYVVAAGNGNQAGVGQDACRFSPARVPNAITIGATDRNDTKTPWSNFGKCVDWFAPGAGIVSAGIAGENSQATMSGTSMASPHTAGVVALYLQTAPASTPTQVRTGLATILTKNLVGSAGKGSPNALLFTSF